MSIEFEIREARLVASIADGGAVVENGLTICFDEGRYESYESRGEGEPMVASLDYHATFHAKDQEPGDRSEAVSARIVIEGTHENGLRLEIRGDGWFGYDEHGHFEGTFTEPPIMLIDEVEDDDEPEVETLSEAEQKRLQGLRPNPPEQYRKAIWGIPQAENDDWP